MIDLHSHILPGLDDGPKTREEAIELAGEYVNLGFSHVVATPHCIFGSAWEIEAEEVRAAADAFNGDLLEEGIPLRVFTGMELTLTPELPRKLTEGLALSLAESDCVLVELPFQRLPRGWDEILFEITARGYRVLLAHPERCEQVVREPEILSAAVKTGYFVQCNWASFAGLYGPEVRKTAYRLARDGLVHCVATDSHGPRTGHLESVPRAVGEVHDLVGTRNLRVLARKNVHRLLRGMEVLACEKAAEETRVKKWRRWFRDF